MKKLACAVAAVSLSLALVGPDASCALAKSRKHASASHTSAAGESSDTTAIKSLLSALGAAASTGDAKAISQLWTEDATYTDEDGTVSKGRAALEKQFVDAFALRGKQQLSLEAESIKQLAPNVVTCQGVVQRQSGSTGAWPVARYTLVMVKQAGTWLVSVATEAPIEARSNADYLRPLSWMVGEWEAQRQGATVHMKAEWKGNHNFIFCTYEFQQPGHDTQIDTQLIGWDPRSAQPVSWNFDSSGGFGQGAWERKGDQWLIDMSGVQASGNATRSTNIISKADGNGFSWQSINRSVDGLALADTEALTVRRVTR